MSGMPGTTSRAEFDELLPTRRVVPVARVLFADSETPLGIFRKLAMRAGGRMRPGSFLLESAEQGGIWSRSRQEYWVKGATSGHTQHVKSVALDCDADALLVTVDQVGPACHTGERSCFHNGQLEPAAPHEALPALERTVSARKSDPPAGSYTAELLADPPLIGAKVEEEAEEVARAAREESDERVAEEAADVLYHLTVLLHSRGLSLADAEQVLDGRRR